MRPPLQRTPPPHLLPAAVDQVTRYPFKTWGFGEDIALRALQEYGELTGVASPGDFVRTLIRPWCAATETLRPADHVAPGVAILELYEKTGDETYRVAAERLASLYGSFAETDGIAVHRPDLATLGTLIWVDCLALDAPFLARWSRFCPPQEHWLDLAVRTLRAYTTALLDEAAGLFRHGYDVQTKAQSPCNWGRGNGWAMHGLVDTLEVLPQDHPTRADITHLLARQMGAVAHLQHESGLWHTILDDPESPLENSTAALFASAALKARRLGLLEEYDLGLDPMLDRATSALLSAVRDDGALPISYATPVGERETYIEAPLGVFPWGQGPLILTFTEWMRSDARPNARSAPEARATTPGGKQA